jgi:hypothetical protein
MAVHGRNAERLEAIVKRYGWPGKSLVGEDAADAAWLVLQHAIAHPRLQRACLPLIREAVALGEAKPWQAAYLEDRIRFFERRPQRYGTQFDWDENGLMSPYAIEDPERVDERRLSIGLSPLAERMEEVRRSAADEPRPANLKEREDEMRAWAKSVGWL